MDKARETRRPWRSWTVIALVLAALALAQACGESSKHTGPTSSASLQLKLRRAGAAEIPSGCTGTYSVSGPGANIQNAPIPAGGSISFQGQVGQTYVISVSLDCGPNGTFSGSATITVQPGGNQAEIVIVATKAGVSCNPSTVTPGQTSTCTCNVQSPTGTTSITWTGAVSPQSGPTTTFSSQTLGTFGIACTVNGVITANTSVTVSPAPPQTGTITVTNSGPFGAITVTFSGPQTLPSVTVPQGGSITIAEVMPGAYQALNSCDGPPAVSFTVTAGQNTPLAFSSQGCG